MITKLLVANRAEIASRIFRTCRALGIETVAVHSDADADLPYVREADHAVRLPGNAPADTYLRTDLIIEAAKAAGADAVHPGYGFLSENADFARAVIAVGLTWVGPKPEAMESMGSKIESKLLMAAAGVPVLPNFSVVLRDGSSLTSSGIEATEADLPLLVKASAGGGGRGMRIVRTLAALPREIEAASAEAQSAFGDGTVFVEPYVERGRHVEVQVLGTDDGVIVLGERDCSLQRRHQKIVEESPAPGLSDATREALHDAGRAAASAIDYLGAGTVEFLYDADQDTFFFLEMNTRLQVEHPVTEAVRDVDLVELQIAVAEGRRVADTSLTRGHAIEVRLYAEDPAADYQPQSGVLTAFEILPPGVQEQDGLRVDAGFESGSEVSTHYDAMLAKVIAHAPTREQAARKLVGALRRARIHGLVTNRDQLVAILGDPDFLAGDVSTAFLDGRPLGGNPIDQTVPATAAAIALAERTRAARTVQQGIPVAWRNVVSQPQVTELLPAGVTEPLRIHWYGGHTYRVDGFTVVDASPTSVTLEADGVRTSYEVTVSGGVIGGVIGAVIGGEAIDVDFPGGHAHFTRVPRFVDPADAVASGSLLAPMPGTVVRVAVEVGQQVAAGDPVLVLEAMKMQHAVSAPTSGTVTEINVEPGTQVAAGEVLAVVEEGAEA